MLQDHKGTDVSFRNLWIVPDIDYDQSLPKFRTSFTSDPTVMANVMPDPKPERVLVWDPALRWPLRWDRR